MASSPQRISSRKRISSCLTLYRMKNLPELFILIYIWPSLQRSQGGIHGYRLSHFSPHTNSVWDVKEYSGQHSAGFMAVWRFKARSPKFHASTLTTTQCWFPFGHMLLIMSVVGNWGRLHWLLGVPASRISQASMMFLWRKAQWVWRLQKPVYLL